jgi:hypothetical protein
VRDGWEYLAAPVASVLHRLGDVVRVDVTGVAVGEFLLLRTEAC